MIIFCEIKTNLPELLLLTACHFATFPVLATEILFPPPLLTMGFLNPLAAVNTIYPNLYKNKSSRFIILYSTYRIVAFVGFKAVFAFRKREHRNLRWDFKEGCSYKLVKWVSHPSVVFDVATSQA